MPPKKKGTGPKSRKKTTSSNSNNSTAASKTLKNVPMLRVDSEDDDSSLLNNNINHLIMNRKNKLGDMFSSQPQSQLSRNKRQLRLFEEDGGFKFKRSQEKEKEKEKVSTPISRLHKELIAISDDEREPITFKTNPKKRKVVLSDEEDNYNEIALSSPIRSLVDLKTRRKPPVKYVDFSDDDDYLYVEEVSKIPLADDTKAGNPEKRRTSYYQRGKRILSIGNGFEGLPHDDVPTSEYYKLLSPQLPEPRRMRQLLIWCFRKKLNQEEQRKHQRKKEKSTEATTVFSIAKVIKEEVLRDLTEGQIETTWYNVNHDKSKSSNNGVYKSLPNPQNKAIEENLDLCRSKIAKLQEESKEWEAVYEKYTKDKPSNFPKIKLTSDDKVENSRGDEVVQTLENSLDEVRNLPNSIENSIDKVSNTAYRLLKGYELIKSLQTKKLNGEVSSLVKDCLTNDDVGANDASRTGEIGSGANNAATPVENSVGNGGSSFWSASRAPTTKELLRGIARLDAR